MDTNNIIIKIINLLERFYNIENEESIYSLLQSTGYFEKYNQVQESKINEILNQYPKCVNQWLNWSENKRSSSGWYFKKDDQEGNYIVGYYPDKENFKSIEYSNVTEACATFIKREIEQIRES